MLTIHLEDIQTKIYWLRGKKVMLDYDLAALYGVETKGFNRSVQRNLERFPEDFMFVLRADEYENLRYQFGTSSSMHGGRRHAIHAFTEQGVAMLSSVLRGKRAVQVNIQIMRTFTRLREMLVENDELRRKVELMEKQYDDQFKIVFDAIRRLLDEDATTANEIGFRPHGE